MAILIWISSRLILETKLWHQTAVYRDRNAIQKKEKNTYIFWSCLLFFLSLLPLPMTEKNATQIDAK
jgi:hypothetical protein